jgi:hypothetical protein
MTREIFIERILRQIYNGQPSDDSNITFGLVNQWLNDAIGIAVKNNYKESIQLDGVAYINNAFYTSFKGLSVTAVGNEGNTYQVSLPQIPIGVGKNEGIAMLQFVDTTVSKTSNTAMPLSMNQVAYFDLMRPVQNKILYWNEGLLVYIKSNILLTKYTANVKMISGGDSTDLTSTLLIPDDYIPTIVEYIKGQLAFEMSRPIDNSNDGVQN